MKEKKKRKKKKKGKKKRKKEAKLAGVIEYLPWFPSLDFSTIRLRHISLFLSSASSKLWSLFQVRFRHLIISPFVLIIPMKLNHKLFNSSGYVVLCLKITNCFFFFFKYCQISWYLGGNGVIWGGLQLAYAGKIGENSYVWPNMSKGID